jgi:hypothetical protein
MTPVLCGYCPRRIVAREGQHVAKGAKALGKVVPLRTILSSICGILGSRERSASSVRTSRMFGFSTASAASTTLAPSLGSPKHATVATKENTHTSTSLCASAADAKERPRKRLWGAYEERESPSIYRP